MVYKTDDGREIGNILDSKIEAQIDTLNDRYASIGISFSLLGIARFEDEVWQGDMSNRYDTEVAPRLGVDQHRVMNVYVGELSSGGLTHIPDDDGVLVGTAKDGVFLRGGSFPVQNSSSLTGEVAVHEVGHYLGLQHTWGSSHAFNGSCLVDDGFTDTGNHAEPNNGIECEAVPLPNGCGDLPVNIPDPVRNYMNYTNEAMCQDQFSGQQIEMMQYVREDLRVDLGTDVPTIYDERSGTVVFNDPTFSNESVFVLPGADVTVTGVVTLENGAQFVVAGGADLDGITGLDLDSGSLFDVRGYDGTLDLTGNVMVADGSMLRLGQPVPESSFSGGHSFPGTPPLSVNGDVTVTGPITGSTFEMGEGGTFTLGASSVARFEGGGRYVTGGSTELSAYSQFILESDAAAPEITVDPAVSTFALGLDARLIIRNSGYTLGGESSFPITVGRLDPNEAWDEIAIDGDGLNFNKFRIEGGTTGVAVYDPGEITIMNSTLRDNGTGLDVRSTGATVVSGSTVEQNGTGVTSGIPEDIDGNVFCFGSCRSDFDILDSIVRDNTGTGVFVSDADAEIRRTDISGNAGYGLYVSNATTAPFTDNLVLNNGNGWDANGAFIAAGGELFLSPAQDDRGENRVANSATTEVFIALGGLAFLGEDSGLTGSNAIFDASGTDPLVYNASKTPVDANYVYWGDPNGPPAGSIVGSVDTTLSLVCDPIDPPDPSDPNPCSSGNRGTGNVVSGGEGTAERGGLGAAIRALRAALAADPSASGADGLVYRLGGLHRRDRADAEGEHAATFGLLRSLLAQLNSPTLPAGIRATAEAALEVAVVDALTGGRSEEAAALVAAGQARVESAEVLRVLALVEASLEAQEGRYGEAEALATAVAESEPNEEAARGLVALAAHYAGRAAEGGGHTRGAPGAAAAGVLEGKAAVAEAVEPGLSVYPNPFGGESGTATVVLTLAEGSEARVMVYDVLGRQVAVLHAGDLNPGLHEFALDGARLPNGVYLVRAEADGHEFTEQVTVVR